MNDANTERSLSRRKLIASLGTAAVAFASGCASSDNTDGDDDVTRERIAEPTEPDDTETDEPGPEIDEPEPDPPGENIEEYGAESNPDDPDPEQARRNLEAILDAAAAAGDGGAIFVPAGTYHYGHDGTGPVPYVSFGDGAPAGISVVGEDPEKSALAITAHAPADIDQTGLYWVDDTDHGTVELENVRVDGNYENLSNLSEAGGLSRGLDFNGTANVYLRNVHVRGWYMKGVFGREVLRSAVRCTFEDNGIARHNDTGASNISHHLSARPHQGDVFVARRCHFKNCSGSAINITGNDGAVYVLHCYIEGTGANVHKLSAGKLVVLRHVYHEANTESLESKLENTEGGFYGRNLIQSLGERGDEPVTVRMEHVESRDMTDYAFQGRDNWGRGPSDITWEGDMIAIHNAANGDDSEVIRTRNDVRFAVSIDRLSLHKSGGVLFDTPGSEGTIGTLRHSGNADVGDFGAITIGANENSDSPFEPAVPSRDEVGINSGDDTFR